MKFKAVLLLVLTLISHMAFSQNMVFGINKDDVYMGEDGNYNSWIMDELRGWGEVNGIEVSFAVDEWSTLEKKFFRQELDGLYPANMLNSRLKFMDFTEIIESEPFCIMAKKNTTVSSLEGLPPGRVGTLESQLLREELSPLLNGIIYYKDSNAALEGLQSGKIDFFIINKELIYSFPDDLHCVGELWFENEGRIALQKGDRDSVASLNNHFFIGNQLRDSMGSKRSLEKTAIIRSALKKKVLITEPTVLDVVIHKDAFPFVEIKNHKLKGSLVDIAEDFNELSPYIKINIVPLEEQGEFNEELEKLSTGEIDAMAPVGMSDKRNLTYKRLHPVFSLATDSVTLFCHTSAPKVGHIFEIKGKLGTVNSHLLEEMAYSNLPEDRVVVYTSREDALRDLNDNKISYLLDTEAIVHGFTLLNKYSNVRKIESLTTFTYGIYLSPLLSDDMMHDLRLIGKAMKDQGRLKGRGDLYDSSVTPVFVDKYLMQLKILILLILLIVIYYQRKGLSQKVQNEKILKALIGSLESVNHVNNEETGEHIVRIGLYSEIIAKSLNLPRKLVGEIKTFSSLHDVGKVAIPPEILKKPGKLTEEEFQIMKTHTERGRDIISKLSGIPSKEDLATNIVLYHHERWDGSGYPEGLKGEEIPLEARIVALADVYDALRMPRAYKKSFSHKETYDVILEGSGKHFDPHLVEIFKNRHLEFYKIYAANS